MSFYTPKTDDQLQNESLLPAGEYDFKVTKPEKKESNSGNKMLVVNLICYAENGNGFVKDFIVPSTNFGERKLKAFAKSINMESEYTKGLLDEHNIDGKLGKVKIKIQPESEYVDKNTGEKKTSPAKNIVDGIGYIESEGPF